MAQTSITQPYNHLHIGCFVAYSFQSHNGLCIWNGKTERRHWWLWKSSITRDSSSEQTHTFFFRIAEQSRNGWCLECPLHSGVRRPLHGDGRALQVFAANQPSSLISGSMALHTHRHIFNDVFALSDQISTVRRPRLLLGAGEGNGEQKNERSKR